MRILLFLLDLFFSRSRCFKDEEMNRFSKRGDPIENRRTPDASKRSIQRRRRTSSSRRIRKPSFTERQKRKHARGTRKRGSLDFKSTRICERERKREMNQTRLLQKRRRHQTRTRSRIFLRDEQPFKRAVPVPLEDVGEVFDRFFGGFVEP